MEFDLTTQKFTECVNINLLNGVIKHAMDNPDKSSEYNKMMNALRNIRVKAIANNGKYEVSYKMKHKLDDMWLGRVFPEQNISLGTIYRPYRHTLCKDYYYDIDTENCQPVILYNNCLADSVDCPKLSYYVSNRDKCILDIMDHYEVNRDIAKRAFVNPINNGSYAAWKKQNGLENKMDLPFLIEYEKEAKTIINHYYSEDKNANVVQLAIKIDSEKVKSGEKQYSNPKGTFMSLILGTNERIMLQIMCKYLIDTYKTNEIILCHDGLMIPKYIIGSETIDSVCTMIENTVIDTMKQYVEYKNLGIRNKEMKEGLEIAPITEQQDTIDSTSYLAIKEKLENNNGLFYCEKDKKFYMKMIEEDGSSYYNAHTQSEIMAKLAIYEVQEVVNGKVVKTPFFKKWLKDPKRRDIKDFVYNLDPNYVAKKDEVNRWEGFLIERTTSMISDEIKKSIDQSLDKYFSAIGNGNEKMKEYLINWIAYLIQKPHEYLVNVPFLRSNDGGTGKTTYVKLIGAILGSDKYVHSANGFSELNTQYTGHLVDCFIYCCEELEYEDGKKNINFLKAWTSQKSISINNKYGSKVIVPNKVRIMITTNGLNAIPVEEGQRRLVISSVSTALKNNKSFWDNFYAMMNDKSQCRYIYDWLKSRDISKWNPNDIPETEIMTSLKAVNKPLVELFIEQNIQKIYNIEESIGATELLKMFNNWLECGHFGVSKYNSQKFGLHLTNYELAQKVFEKKHTKTGIRYAINKEYLTSHFGLTDEDINGEDTVPDNELLID